MTNNGGSDDLAVRNQYLDSLSSLEWQLGNYSAWLNGSADANFSMVRIPFASLALQSQLISLSLWLSPLDHRASIVSYPKLCPTETSSIRSLTHTILISLVLSGEAPRFGTSARN
jgi:hypothetical protein